MATAKSTPAGAEHVRIGSHLRKHDHWTFLVALALVALNVPREDRRLSALALAFLLAALGYDTYEVLVGRE